MTEKISKDQVYDLTFGVRRSVRYHHRRANFFATIHRIAMFFSVFMAMGAGFAAHLQWSWMASVLGVIVALVVAIDATADCSNKCAKHMLLAYRFQELEKKIRGKSLSEYDFEMAVQERLSIEQDEYAPLRLLDVMCHYELLISMGHHPDRVPSIPWHRRWAAQLFTQTEYAQSLKGIE